jgi:hypothetical protein
MSVGSSVRRRRVVMVAAMASQTGELMARIDLNVYAAPIAEEAFIDA